MHIIEEAYRRYGFQPLETPAIEYLEILTGKSLENDKLIYQIQRARGGEEDKADAAIALRYDLTVPLARVVAQYAELPRPFKRYQIQPVWRADRPQPRQGRFREFVQCDADIVGTASLLADAEIIALTYEILRDLGFERFVIRISSRKYLMGFAVASLGGVEDFSSFCRSLDKLDKIGWEGVSKELAARSIDISKARSLIDKLTDPGTGLPSLDRAADVLSGVAEAEEGISEIREVISSALSLGVPEEFLRFDPVLARGLDYYTGPIYESVLPDHLHIGSLSGGGRYDGLVQTFSKQGVPATGATLGLDRIQTALTQLGKFETAPAETQVLIAQFDEEGMAENLKMAAELRRAGVRVEVWYDNDRMKKQLAYADRQEIPLVLICGPDERKKNSAALKNLRTRTQQEIDRAHIVDAVKAQLRDL